MIKPLSEYLINILYDLLEKKVDFIICGGVAVVLNGVERLTVDLDLSLARNEDNLKAFLQTMTKHQLKPRVPLPPEVILDDKLVEAMVTEKNALVFTFIDNENPFKQVDIFITEDKSYDSLLNSTIELDLGNGKIIKVLTALALIDMKRKIKNPRSKDLFDIEELTKLVLKNSK